MANLTGILGLFAALSLASCASINGGTDVPRAVDADYLERETARMEEADRCGPEFIQEKVPGVIQTTLGALTDGPFRPVCARHDACYRLEEQSQAWCDDRMRDEMIAICNTGKAGAAYNIPAVGPAICRYHAGLYYGMINSPGGAYAYGGDAGGEIVEIQVRQLADEIGDDELQLCVTVLNNTKLMQEYDVELRDMDGTLIDREPDLYEKNVRAGESEDFCVSTDWDAAHSVATAGEEVRISVRADTPDSWAIWGDMVVVDTWVVPLK